LKKIVIIGPESTGKSTLCESLAQHYGMLWCPEFAREYLMTNGTQYQPDDLLTIAKGQLALEEEYTLRTMAGWALSGERWVHAQSLRTSARCPMLFIDTDMYVMKVWSEYVFGTCNPFILDQIASREYDLYLLCKPDLPWVQDELREYPDEGPRQELYQIYRDLLVNQQTPWMVIEGDYDLRLKNAIAAVDQLMVNP
jgi:NadR type nicotinamide-nucleotide adenylyltransferase